MTILYYPILTQILKGACTAGQAQNAEACRQLPFRILGRPPTKAWFMLMSAKEAPLSGGWRNNRRLRRAESGCAASSGRVSTEAGEGRCAYYVQVVCARKNEMPNHSCESQEQPPCNVVGWMALQGGAPRMARPAQRGRLWVQFWYEKRIYAMIHSQQTRR